MPVGMTSRSSFTATMLSSVLTVRLIPEIATDPSLPTVNGSIKPVERSVTLTTVASPAAGAVKVVPL
jgi:hypothetical protein